ncbi:hypothetical protein D3C86_409270 [compost metagenome]
MFAHAPVQVHFALAHGAAVVQQLGDQRVHREAFRNRRDAFADALEFGQRHGGVGLVGPLGAQERRPVDGVLALVVGQHRFDGALAVFHELAVVLDELIGFAFGQHALRGQLVGVQLARAGVMADALVHQGLRQRRGVLLVVAQLAEANDVHDDVMTELQAVVQGQLGDEHHGFGIVAVDVEHRGFDHLDHVGAIQRRTRVARVGRGEADLVVDDDVQRAARAVAARLGQVQGFHHDALAGESRVAVHQHRQHLLAFAIAAAFLASAHAAFDHGVDDFQVGRVERQRQVDRTATGGQVAREAVVVLHVAVGQAFGVLAFELGEQVAGHLAHDVHEQVQAAAVGHADHDFLDAVFTGVVHHFVHRGDEAFAAFQREALLADVLGVQEALEPFGLGQLLQDMALFRGRVGRRAQGGFQAFLDPALGGGVGDMREFGTDAAAVGVAQRLQDVAQRHGAGGREVGVGGRVGLVQIGFGQAIEGGIEFRNRGTFLALERIQVGPARAQRAVGGNQRLHRHLLAGDAQVGFGRALHEGIGLGALGKRFDDGSVGLVASGFLAVGCGSVLQLVEIFAPIVRNRTGIVEVGFVKLLNIRGVTPKEIRRG